MSFCNAPTSVSVRHARCGACGAIAQCSKDAMLLHCENVCCMSLLRVEMHCVHNGNVRSTNEIPHACVKEFSVTASHMARLCMHICKGGQSAVEKADVLAQRVEDVLVQMDRLAMVPDQRHCMCDSQLMELRMQRDHLLFRVAIDMCFHRSAYSTYWDDIVFESREASREKSVVKLAHIRLCDGKLAYDTPYICVDKECEHRLSPYALLFPLVHRIEQCVVGDTHGGIEYDIERKCLTVRLPKTKNNRKRAFQ